jgi:serine/threonine-protein kinase
LTLSPDRTISESGTVRANATVNYIIRGEQDQRLAAAIPSEGVLMTVLGPDRKPVGNRARRVQQWQGTLPFTGNYTIQLSPVQGLSESNYTLELSLADPTQPKPKPSPSASPSPSESPIAEYEAEPIKLSAGQLELAGQSTPTKVKRYLINLQQKQELAVQVPKDSNVSLDIRDPKGQILEAGVKFWKAPVPISGEYKIDVIASEKPTNFKLNVSVGKTQ